MFVYEWIELPPCHVSIGSVVLNAFLSVVFVLGWCLDGLEKSMAGVWEGEGLVHSLSLSLFHILRIDVVEIPGRTF